MEKQHQYILTQRDGTVHSGMSADPVTEFQKKQARSMLIRRTPQASAIPSAVLHPVRFLRALFRI